MFCHVRVGFQDFQEVGIIPARVLHFPRLHGVVLDQLVRGFAGKPLPDQREQNGLGIPHAQRQPDVLLHVGRIDDQAVHQPGEQAEHVIQQRAGIGEDDALHRGVRNVAFVPEGNVLERRHGIAAQDAGEAGQTFPRDGIAFVRHGAGAFLPLRERFLGLEHFGALEMAEFHRPAFDARADQRQRGLEFGMNIPLHHLRGDGRGAEPKLLANIRFHARRKMRAGADGPGNLADGDNLVDTFEAFQRTAELIMHQGQLEAEGGRLRMNAMAAADARGELVFARARGNGLERRLHIRDENLGTLLHLDGVAGVAHIAAGEAEMEPAAGVVVDDFGDGGGETDDVVVQHLFQFPLAGDEAGEVGEPFITTGLDAGKILRRHDLFLHQRLAGEQFDLQPDLQLVLVGPNRPHFGAGIARNHAASLGDSGRG